MPPSWCACGKAAGVDVLPFLARDFSPCSWHMTSPVPKAPCPCCTGTPQRGWSGRDSKYLCRTNQAPFFQRLCKASCCKWIPSNAVNNSLKMKKNTFKTWFYYILLHIITYHYVITYYYIISHSYILHHISILKRLGVRYFSPPKPKQPINQVASIRQLWASWIFPKRNAQSPIWAITPGVSSPNETPWVFEDTSKSTNVEAILVTGNCMYSTYYDCMGVYIYIYIISNMIVASCGKWCIDNLKASLELAAELRLYRICVCTSDSAAWPSKSHRRTVGTIDSSNYCYVSILCFLNIWRLESELAKIITSSWLPAKLLKTYYFTFHTVRSHVNTVDGGNLAPPRMYKTL